jgi:CheY-like chemotaxis protein
VDDDGDGWLRLRRDDVVSVRLKFKKRRFQMIDDINNNGRHLDLLLADLKVPKSSGIQLALLLRLEIPNLPVLLTSGYPVSAWSERDCADLERLGSNYVTILQKPFRPQTLSDAVCELIGVPTTEMVRTAWLKIDNKRGTGQRTIFFNLWSVRWEAETERNHGVLLTSIELAVQKKLRATSSFQLGFDPLSIRFHRWAFELLQGFDDLVQLCPFLTEFLNEIL